MMQSSELTIAADPRLDFARSYLADFLQLAGGISVPQVAVLIEYFQRAYRDQNRVFLMGNGGSAAAASHFACDLATTARLNRGESGIPRFRVSTLVDNVPWLTALANDIEYREVFSEQIRNLVTADDLVVAISVSGNSPNVLEGLKVAKSRGAWTVALLGKDGGEAARLADHAVVVRSDDYGYVENVHVILMHLVAAFFAKSVSSRLAESSATR
ncbi:MAG TPA: SIS domain-containing protein [Longimicrobiaceae bacterium]|nr:SIS domain-containing protein [Longimicrobiaceae bacterium]